MSFLHHPGVDSKLFSEFIRVTKLADPTVQVIASSYHDAGYENAWIQFVDRRERLVQVQTIESRIVIVFETKKGDIAKYREGWVTPVTFRCKNNLIDCDIGLQEKTYIGNAEVQPTMWKTSGSNRKLKITPQ